MKKEEEEDPKSGPEIKVWRVERERAPIAVNRLDCTVCEFL